ncbi:MAG: Maf family protein [Rhodospirillaceae bacterium]|nr:Maf family protein [Rhodospirillaceae bacterium]
MLASASPRRLDLLAQIGLRPDAVDAPHVDESVRPHELPATYAKRIAGDKLTAVVARHPGAFVLAADTVVALGRRILPKAEDAATARRCLELLSGRRHKVVGGIAIAAAGEWHGKAGGYAIQGAAAAFIPRVAGSYSNVVGLSLSDAYAMLTGLGFRS